MSIVATSISGDAKEPVVKSEATESDLLASRINARKAKEPEIAETPVEESDEPETKPEVKQTKRVEEVSEKAAVTESAEVKEATKDADVLSKFDLDKMSEAELTALADKTRSKAISRFGELTADKKALQQQLAVLQQQLTAQQQAAKPLLESAPKIPKEITALKSADELQAHFKQAEEVIDWAEGVLDGAEHLSSSDVVVTVDGKEYTKEAVKKHMKEARKVKDKYLPARYAEIQAASQMEGVRQQWTSKADDEVEWAKDENSDAKKLYDSISSSPSMRKIRELVPEAVEIDYVLKHAVNSMQGKRYHALTDAEEKAKPSTKITPPGRVSGVAAGRGEAEVKQMKELESKVRTSGSYEDFLSLRIKQRTAKR